MRSYLCLGGLSLLATIAANGLTSRDYFDNVVSNLLERMAWGLPTQFVTLAATVYRTVSSYLLFSFCTFDSFLAGLVRNQVYGQIDHKRASTC